MRFAKPRISDEDEVEGILYPGRVDECEDIILADYGIEMPVELVHGFDMFYSRQTQESFDLVLSSIFGLLLEEIDDGIALA